MNEFLPSLSHTEAVGLNVEKNISCLVPHYGLGICVCRLLTGEYIVCQITSKCFRHRSMMINNISICVVAYG